MAEQQEREECTLLEFTMLDLEGPQQSIVRPKIHAKNFEIKLALLQMIQSTLQFHGLALEDPNAQIMNFLEICNTFKYHGVSDEFI